MLADKKPRNGTARLIENTSPSYLARLQRVPLLAWIILLLALIGLSVRSLEFHRNYSLMMDECAVCMNIFDRPLPDLTKTLDYDQAAPLGYLFLQKLFFVTFGMSDTTTRVIPFIFGIMTLPLSVILFSRVFPSKVSAYALVLSIGLICLNRALAIYSGISKQYSLECSVTLIVLYIFYRPLTRPSDAVNDSAGSRWILILSPLLVWFSYGAVFVLAGCGAALVGRALLSHEKPARPVVWSFCLSALINLSIFFHLSVRAAMANQRLSSMWSAGYMPLWPVSLALKWLWQTFVITGEEVIHSRVAFLLPLGLLLTCISAIWRRNWFWLACVASVLATLCGSALKRYPFAGRVSLFLLPILVLMLAKALDVFYERWRSVAAVGAIIILAAAGSSLIHQIVLRNNPIDNVRKVHRLLVAKFEPGDDLWVAPRSQPCFRYYVRDYPLAGASVHFLRADEMPALSPGRHWLLAMRTPWSPSEGEALLGYFSHLSTSGDSFDVELTTARLFVVP